MSLVIQSLVLRLMRNDADNVHKCLKSLCMNPVCKFFNGML